MTVHALGEEQGTHFVSMEYVEGPSLAEVIREHGPLPSEMTRQVFRQLLAGLAAAHEAGLIHRDIKSSNILLDRLGGDALGDAGQTVQSEPRASARAVHEESSSHKIAHGHLVKIADFGLALMITGQTRMTMPDSLLGTPEYMSPEQARGDENIDHRTDLYSAGVVLYEMLTGRTPFRADTPTAVIHQILHDEPANPRMLIDSADPVLASLAMRLMTKERGERFDSSAEATAALNAGDPPVHRRCAEDRLGICS